MLHIPIEWEETAREILKEKGTILVLGLPNAGKSTFVKYLTDLGIQRGLKVAVINSDLGQADIGVPGTISLIYPEREISSSENIFVNSWYFVGEITPVGKFLQVITGVRKLLDEAKDKADLIIINTCGLVQGRLGKILKYYKTSLINPDFIVGIYFLNELDSLLKIIGRFAKKVYKLPRSPYARERGPEERKEFREKRYEKYFKDSTILVLPLLLVYSIDKYVDFTKKDYKGRLVGLLDKREKLLSLGIVENIDLEKRIIYIFTPLKNPQEVKRIEIGGIKLKIIKEPQ
uniref:AAA family ATPase n=1 Tax=Dictyoglomus turgidum TaxID=513050 RepID=A0A7C3SPL5_9BACT